MIEPHPPLLLSLICEQGQKFHNSWMTDLGPVETLTPGDSEFRVPTIRKFVTNCYMCTDAYER